MSVLDLTCASPALGILAPRGSARAAGRPAGAHGACAAAGRTPQSARSIGQPVVADPRARLEALHDSIDDVAESALAAPQADATAGRDLARLLDSLPAAQREAIVLTKGEGLSVSEVCARTGASGSAFKVQVHRGLERLAALVRQPA